MFCTLFLRKTRTKHRSVHNERNKVEQEKTIFSSIVSMCWCGASDKSVITQWIIFLEHWFKSWTFPLVSFFLSVALLFNFFLLTRKTYCRFKPPNNASQIRWFNAGFDIFLHLTTRLGWLFFFLIDWNDLLQIVRQALLKKKNFTRKRHLCYSCTKPFNCVIGVQYNSTWSPSSEFPSHM